MPLVGSSSDETNSISIFSTYTNSNALSVSFPLHIAQGLRELVEDGDLCIYTVSFCCWSRGRIVPKITSRVDSISVFGWLVFSDHVFAIIAWTNADSPLSSQQQCKGYPVYGNALGSTYWSIFFFTLIHFCPRQLSFVEILNENKHTMFCLWVLPGIWFIVIYCCIICMAAFNHGLQYQSTSEHSFAKNMWKKNEPCPCPLCPSEWMELVTIVERYSSESFQICEYDMNRDCLFIFHDEGPGV